MEETAEALAGLNISTPEGSKFSEITASGNARLHNGHVYGNVNHYYPPAESIKASEDKKGNKHWTVRRQRNALFTGQESVLADLEKCLLPTSDRDEYSCPQYVLQGIGGVGKSEIALQFAYRHRQAFWGVFWIDLGSTDAARLGFSQIANKCGWSIDSGENSTSDVVDQLSNCTEPWLLLLDNCDDPEQDYSGYFPSSPQGAVIMTTRIDLASEYGTTGSYKLDGLDLNSSIALLAKAANLPNALTEGQMSAAKHVTERLGYHALAITVAGSVLKAGLHSLEDYAQVLVQKEAELLKTRPKQAQSTYGTVHATFEVSAQRLQESGEESAKHALELLGVLAFLDRTNVTENMFLRAWKFGTKRRKSRKYVKNCTNMTDHSECSINMLSPWHFNTALGFSWASSTDMSPFRKARSRLHELSLITWASEDNTISMHPLLHSWARNRLNHAEQLSVWHATAATLVLSTEQYSRWRDFTYPLQRHLEVCFDSRIEGSVQYVCPLDPCRILHFFWWQLHRTHSRSTSNVIIEMERLLPRFVKEESSTCLEVYRMRVVVLREADDLTAGIALGKKIVAARQRTANPEDFYLRRAQRSLAGDLRRAGDYQASIDILEDVKRVEDGMIDIKPSDRCATLSRLASAYLELDRPQESLELLEEVVAIQEQFMKAEDPELLTSRHELGRAYLHCGQAEKAVNILEDVVRIQDRILAPEDKERLASQHVLGMAYLANGKIEKAVAVLEEVVRIQERTLKPEHAKRLESQRELGGAYLANVQNEKAVAVLEEVVETEERTLALDHADRLASQHELARAYRANEQLSTAFPILEHVVDVKRRVRSPEDPRRYVSEDLLLSYYIEDSQNQKARQFLDDMKVTSHLLSEEDREDLENLEKRLLTLEHKVAFEHVKQGRFDDAIEIMERVVPRREELLATNSRARHTSRRNLLLCYIEASQSLKARRLLDQIKETSNLLSEEDREYLREREKGLLYLEHRLSLEHFDQGRLDEAIELMKCVVDGRSKLFAAESEPRHNSEYNLLLYYVEASRTPEARHLLDRIKETDHLLSEEDQQDLRDLEKNLEEQEEQEWLSTDDSEDDRLVLASECRK